MSGRRRLTEQETTMLLEAARGRVVALAFGPGGVWLKAVDGNAWAVEILDRTPAPTNDPAD